MRLPRHDGGGERLDVDADITPASLRLLIRQPDPLGQRGDRTELLPKGLLYVRRENGSSIDANALAKRMRKHLKSIGVVGYTVHGLRHLRGMELAEAGCSENEIMAQLGHVTPQMAAHYTKAARRKALSASAAKKLEQGERTIVKLKV